MDIPFVFDKKIAGTELIVQSRFLGDQPVKITLSGHKAYDCTGSPAWWAYNWYFSFCSNQQNYILQYQSTMHGEGWFLEETNNTELNTTSPIVFRNVGNREQDVFSGVDLVSDHAVIDKILGDRPRHCRGY